MSRNLADGPFAIVLEQIEAKHGNTLVSTIRGIYGFNFLPTVRSNEDLRNVLLRVDEPSRVRMMTDFARTEARTEERSRLSPDTAPPP